MAYNDEAVRAKLSTLNETQESIVTVAQWIMFHRRHADRTASLWLEKLKDSNANKRLNLIYLANEVVQQSKARKRDDFLLAFSPLIPEATTTAFRGAHGDVRHKIRRVVEVWRQRNIFDEAIQDAVEKRLDEVEKSQSSGTKKLLGGNLFSGSSVPGPSAPAELKTLTTLQEDVNKAIIGNGDKANKAKEEYAETVESVAGLKMPMQVARYSALFKTLASAENAVAESVKAREDLLTELESLVQTNRDALENEKNQHDELSGHKSEIETKKKEVEDAIMRGLASVSDDQNDAEVNGNGDAHGSPNEFQRPATEELTPPPVETITPVESPEFQPADVAEEVPQLDGVDGADEGDLDDRWNIPEAGAEEADVEEAGTDLIASLSRSYGASGMDGEESVAKRQRTEGTPVPMGLDAGGGSIPGLNNDIDDLIRTEGRN